MDKVISNVVFTRNRPLQLDAYIRSLYRHMPEEKVQTYILYKADLFDNEYSELFRHFSNVVVIREKDFHDDFVTLFEQLDTKYVLFGTDDVVYYDSVDFTTIDNTFAMYHGEIFGFSLRLAPQKLKDDGENVVTVKCGNEEIYRINWKRAKSRNGRYPFELNSTVYTTSMVRRILEPVAIEHPNLKRIFDPESLLCKSLGCFFNVKNFLISLDTFHDPNALEGHCCRWCRTHKRSFPRHLYFQKICASAVQVNRVTTSIDNPVDGSQEHTVEALNEKYRQGYRFDLDSIQSHKPATTHVGRDHFKLKCH